MIALKGQSDIGDKINTQVIQPLIDTGLVRSRAHSFARVGAAQRFAVAVTIIGGQMLCLLPTLLVTPVAYSLLAEAEERGFRKSLAPLLARLRPGFRAEALKGR